MIIIMNIIMIIIMIMIMIIVMIVRGPTASDPAISARRAARALPCGAAAAKA